MGDAPIILLVDSDRAFAEHVREEFAVSGYRVETCPDADTALALAPRLRPDVVITEMILPGRSGFQVVERLKQLDPTLPVIIAATFGSPAQESLAEFLGADDFVYKPVAAERLLERVRRFCTPGLNPPHTSPASARSLDAVHES